MESLTSGTLAGVGSFRCARCHYVLARAAEEPLPRCPSCDATRFVDATLFPPARSAQDEDPAASPEARAAFLATARRLVTGTGGHLAFRDGGEVRVLAIAGDGLRIGRSLAADVRFDDTTVSRRHALVVGDDDGAQLLDDRSLNGTFVNGDRVARRTLRDGDEVVTGRHRLLYLVGAAARSDGA